jgi:hypothetical protein
MKSHCKRTFRLFLCRYTVDGQHDLQRLLKQALAAKAIALQRRETIDLIDRRHRLINTSRDVKACLCGIMVSYADGQNQSVIGLDSKAKELSVQQLAPPVTDPTRRNEFLDGTLYFACHKNAVVVVGSQAMRASTLADHLNWLLGPDGSNVLTGGVMVSLVDPDTKARKKARLVGVQRVHMSSAIPLTVFGGSQVKEAKFKPDGAAWSGLVRFLGAMGVNIPTIDFSSDIKPGDLSVDMEIVDHRDRRKVDAQAKTPIIDPLANALTHAGNLDCKFIFRDGTSVHGSDLQVRDSQSVPCTNGIPDPAALFVRMVDWLEGIKARPDIAL